MNLSDKKVMVFDKGLFINVAIRLAKDFGKVYYFRPKPNHDPKMEDYIVGSGIPNVERVENFWDYVDKVDLIVFTDVYDGDLQEYLRRKGYLVWGCGKSEELEIDRWKNRLWIADMGMNMPETYKFTGIEDLKNHIKNKEDLFIKLSKYRGNFETFHHINWKITEPYLDDKALTFGFKKSSLTEFIVEEPIPGIETGYDSYTINGETPDIVSQGYEIKNQGYIAKIKKYSDMPIQLLDIDDKLSTVFKKNESRGFFSTEVRVDDDGIHYFLDPCMRCGSPPTEILIDIYENISEIIFKGASGVMIQPKPIAKYGAQAVMYSEFVQYKWLNVYFPKKYGKNIKLRNFCMINGDYYVIPMGKDDTIIGSIVVYGDTIEELKEQLEEIEKEVQYVDKDIRVNFFDKALEEIEKGEKVGINF